MTDRLPTYVDLQSRTVYHRQAPFMDVAGEHYRREVFVHDSILNDNGTAMEALKDALLRWWLSGGDKAEPAVELDYYARCEACVPPIDEPFGDVVKRAVWAREHNEATEHRITMREEPRQ